MTVRLKVDKDFTPYTIADEAELFPNGIFVFNITKILEYIEEHPNRTELKTVKVTDYCRESSALDESYIDSVDMSKPIILAEISPGRYNLIDGHHRIENARRMGMDGICAYKLNVKQHYQFLTSKKAYLTFVEYWNNKLDQNESDSEMQRRMIQLES
jgi:hypothetical protein